MTAIRITADTSNRASRLLTGILIALVMGAGFYFRTINLRGPSFNEDELFHVRAAAAMNETGRPVLPGGHEYRRALPFTWIMAAVFRHAGGPDEFSARMISVVFGTILIWLTYLTGAAIADRATGVLAAAFLVVSPYAILLSRFARMYTVHQCLYLATFLLFFRAYEDDGLSPRRRAGLMAAGAAMFVFAVQNHELAVFFVAGLFGYCLWRALQTAYLEGGPACARSRYGRSVLLMAFAGLSALALPQVREKIAASWLWIPEWAQANQDNYFFYRWLLRNEYGLWCYVAVPGALWLAARRQREGAYLVSHFVLPMMILSVWPLKQSRYMAHLFPLFLILMAAGFRAVVGGTLRVTLEAWNNRGGPIRPPLARAVSAPVFVAAGLVALWFSPGAATPEEVRAGLLGDSGAVNFLPWRDAGQYLGEHVLDDDLVIASRTSPVLYYFGRVDYSLDRQGDQEIRSFGWRTADGHRLDNPGGVAYLENESQFKRALETDKAVWMPLQRSLFRTDRSRLSAEERTLITEDFRRAWASRDGTILIFYRPRAGSR